VYIWCIHGVWDVAPAWHSDSMGHNSGSPFSTSPGKNVRLIMEHKRANLGALIVHGDHFEISVGRGRVQVVHGFVRHLDPALSSDYRRSEEKRYPRWGIRLSSPHVSLPLIRNRLSVLATLISGRSAHRFMYSQLFSYISTSLFPR
jgi:hypothetical protein